MKRLKKISNISKETNNTYNCRNCYIIRFFLLAVIFIIIFALVQSDNLKYLNFVTPINAAISILVLGMLLFIIKLTKYLLEKK